MQNRLRFLLCFMIFSTLSLWCETLGYIDTRSMNIGDDFQTIAVKKFLPKDAIPVDRDFIGEFIHDSKVKVVVNGWFMNQKGVSWDHPKPPPVKCWPPSSFVDPFFISIHFNERFYPTVFAEENVKYLKDHAPIGARDLTTLDELQKRNIPSYFSGCLTLTLENKSEIRTNIIYLVDIDEQCIRYIKSVVKSPIVILTHERPILHQLNGKDRLTYAEHVLDLYRHAKCVVTRRLHGALPCLALETPVLLVHPGGCKFEGLSDLVFSCSKEHLCEGKVNYNFDAPPENPKSYVPIRENLINIMNDWVQKNSK